MASCPARKCVSRSQSTACIVALAHPVAASTTRTTLASKLRSLENLRGIIKKEQSQALLQKQELDRRRKRKQIAMRIVPNLPEDVNEKRRLEEVCQAHTHGAGLMSAHVVGRDTCNLRLT